ncbi:hypothetical protein [Nitrosomonas sp.]|uniref:hypothetical protein n=1 Tax=Nitrosomonas sp. TaxID=42353 RepID=UPI0025D94A17|nr:hypothetical protein [Nitrosomonas sp.]
MKQSQERFNEIMESLDELRMFLILDNPNIQEKENTEALIRDLEVELEVTWSSKTGHPS